MPFDGPMPWKRWIYLAVLVLFALTAQPAFGAGWSLMLQQGQIGLTLPDIHSGGWAVTGIRADVVTAVEADNRAATVHFRSGSRLRAAGVVQESADSSLQLEDVRVDLRDVTLTVNLKGTEPLPDRSTVAGHVVVEVGALNHPRLKRQGWRFEGTVNGPLTDLSVEGQVRSDAGLVADVTVRNVPGEYLAARATAKVDGEKGSKAMAGTLADWPELLELHAGQVQAEAEFRTEPGTPLALHGQLNFDGVGGVMDRTAISGLNGRLLISLEQDLLTARFRDVTIGQINSGIGIGPVRFLADYEAPQSDVLGGVLNLQQATAGFLDGRLRVAPGAIDLSTKPWQVPVDVYELSLARLLQVYPTEGLEGTGELSGRIPVLISDAGIKVEQGKISASAPGGVLELPAERLQAMLGSSEAMNLVVEALQNFHYSVLESTIDYDEKGKLVLDLSLEGENPEVRGGQPVVLNISLEEDIPALLTSLQLSGRVNEAVTERVRERLQQSGQEAVP
ncbi:YdbH domain-containing protein [Marinobacter sp. HN1S83]|uniref:intermembrane phospholipid transport protein YdbH family protein n=1 Tax=Marinobacter sp. HN1S83 TaxID=3382301 RepID=UPI00387B7759